MSKTLELASELISRASITPEDGGCQQVISEHLESMGFQCESLTFGAVQNLWARHGEDSPMIVFAGHTDVVPTGPLEEWDSDPFQPTQRNGYLYGRGAADMKGSLAAMVAACKDFISEHTNHKGSIGFLLTSDEEGPAVDGTVKVIETLLTRGAVIDWCLIGEPTCTEKLGDVIKNGRRGSLTGDLIVNGIQGHVAYPQHARNPIHDAAPALTELSTTVWDRGNEHFPPTTFQITHVEAGTGADNVIPGTLTASFNFRYSTESNDRMLMDRVKSILDQHGLTYTVSWRPPGQPFLTPAGDLVAATQRAIKDITGIEAELSTSGGTSDGRFIAPTGSQVVELGPVNATIHKINECVRIEDLDTLARIYRQILTNLLVSVRL